MSDSIVATVKLSNTGKYDGEEVVQLYVRDLVGKGVARPLKQLKGFEKVMIKKGQLAEVKFKISTKDLAFYRLDKTIGAEAGDFEVYVGGSSDNLPLKASFNLK